METIRVVFLVACLGFVGIKIWKHFLDLKKTEDNATKDVKLVATKKKKEDLQFTLETVNSWVNNCDQKASILLAVIGVAITVIMTGDFMKFLRGFIFIPFVHFYEGNRQMVFSLDRFTVFILLVIAVVFLSVTCCYLFKAIVANIDYKKIRDNNPGMVERSYLFFGSISDLSYEDFNKDDVRIEDDLNSQIYANSKIATQKFKNYNEGLYWFKLLLIVAVMLFVAVMFVK